MKQGDAMLSMEQVQPQEDSDEDVCEYTFNECGRLILNTIHGQIIIDIRAGDVNSFVFKDGRRIDHLLLQR